MRLKLLSVALTGILFIIPPVSTQTRLCETLTAVKLDGRIDLQCIG